MPCSHGLNRNLIETMSTTYTDSELPYTRVTLQGCCSLRKNIRPPLCHGCEEPGREISSRVDGITRVESKCGSNNQEKQTNSQRLQSNFITIGVL